MKILKELLLAFIIALTIFVLVILWIMVPWIRWVLFVIFTLFGLIVLLVIILCLGRIKYKVDAHVDDKTSAYIEVSYLMRLVRYTATYKKEKLNSRLRIAWVRLGESSHKTAKKKTSSTSTISAGVHVYDEDILHVSDAIPPTTKAKQHKNERITEKSEDMLLPKTSKLGHASTPPIQNPKKTIKDRFEALISLIGDVKQKKATLTSLGLKTIISLCIRCLKKIGRAIKPKQFEVAGILGFNDPCTTGWIMGAIEAFLGVMQWHKNIHILGSYHEKALRLDIDIKGHVRLFRLIWPLIWLYCHKPIREFIKQIR